MVQSPLNDTIQPVDSEEKGRSPTTDRRWLIEKKVRGFNVEPIETKTPEVAGKSVEQWDRNRLNPDLTPSHDSVPPTCHRPTERTEDEAKQFLLPSVIS